MKAYKFIFQISFLTCLMISCTKDDNVGLNINSNDPNPHASKAQLGISITDAPIDDNNVSACFVTIQELSIDGENLEGFNQVTLDLLAYQNGETYFIGDFELAAQSYSKIDLKILGGNDGTTQHPYGSYIKDKQGNYHALSETDLDISLETAFKADTLEKTHLVLDFDLRKCIKSEVNTDSKYSFVSEEAMAKGIRISSKMNTHLFGKCNAFMNFTDDIVVYAYKKGEFNESQELQVDAETGLQFSGAVTSALVDEDSNFELNYLVEGDYELHFYGYDRDSKGSLFLSGRLKVEAIGELLNLSSLNISSEADLSLEVLILGLE